MTLPKAYDPEHGYRYQIFCRNPEYGREWEHCDYAVDHRDKNYLIRDYSMAYGPGWQFKSVQLPVNYWPRREACTS